MKNIIYMGWLLAMSAYLFTACSPKEFDDYSAGALPTESDISFTVTESADNSHLFEFKNVSTRAGQALWNFGNYTTGSGNEAKAEYPFAGEYEVVLTLVTTGGSISKTHTIIITEDDTTSPVYPLYLGLTGGAANPGGKTWVFDQYKSGHFGVGPKNAPSPEWWAAGPNDKLESSLYDQKFNFEGIQLVWENKGKIYANGDALDALAKEGYTKVTAPEAGDFDVEYIPNDEYFYALESDSMLTITAGGFLGFYVGTSKFKILSIDENYVTLRANSMVKDGDAWFFRFVVENKNIKPGAEPEKEPVDVKAIPLVENFEGGEPSVSFVEEGMGASTSHSAANPDASGINTSSKVYLYEKKGGEFYSNISFTALDYKFDLTTQNIIKLKVYIPSTNDYITENEVAGDWITNKVLQKSLAIKLQNTDLAEPWNGQKEVLFEDLEMDKWLNLSFDFSDVSDQKDFNKIVLQFGTEGHDGGGIFYIDDFSFE